jgi:DNA-binding GntR family transcriptional regulator
VTEASPGPEYRRVLTDLLGKLDGTTYKVGDLIPSIPQLAAAYDTTEGIARHAVAELRTMRLVQTQHGVGTKVVALYDPSEQVEVDSGAIWRELRALRALVARLAEEIEALQAAVQSPRPASEGQPPARGSR